MVNMKKYEIAINEASYELCSKDASLLLNCQRLLEKSVKYFDESAYDYARNLPAKMHLATKRKYLSTKIKQHRIATLNPQIRSFEGTASLLEKQKLQYVNVSKFL